MDKKKFGYYIFLGLVIGAVLGSGVGAANGNPLMGLTIGALIGLSIGWFGAAAIQQQKGKDQ